MTIWTDVDGVMSADPRKVPEAYVLDELSYDEAMELAYFGAKVLHPDTMAPVVRRKIPVFIKNSRRPELPGTRIAAAEMLTRSAADTPSQTVRGFATIEDTALVNVEGSGMIGVPGIAQRLFGTLREVDVSVIMISQASSEHSICFAIPQGQAEQAKAALEQAFFAELHHGYIQQIEVTSGCTLLAAVGDDMASVPGVSARFFGALGRAGVNIRATAQGASERNITAVIDSAQATRALRAVHAGFYLSDQTLSVGLIGPGVVGAVLLAQLAEAREALHRDFHIDLRVRAIARSAKMLLDEGGIELRDWARRLDEVGSPTDLGDFIDWVDSEQFPHSVIIDCTASAEIARKYPDWLERGVHVITPNKKANSASQEIYARLRRTARSRRTHYLYEATVGAGLPVIGTLRDLIKTGDEVLRIEGVLSGTLSYLFNRYDGSEAFSKIVADARRRGYTEPDPREDLSGTDVARKLIILARELGLEIEPEDIDVENLVPEALRDITEVDAFLSGLADYDDAFAERVRAAAAEGKVLRYVGVIDPKGPTAGVQLQAFELTHAFAGLTGTDNIIAFTTGRYSDQPLTVRGPGAGPDVTAGGVFADLLRLASYLGAVS